MNRADIRARILLGLNEPLNGSGFEALADTNAVIDEAFEIIAEEIKELHRTAYFSMLGGEAWFDIRAIAPTCFAPFRLWSQTDEQRMAYTTIDELDSHSVRWLDTIADRPSRWYGLTQYVFGIYPRLSGEASDVFRLDYLAWPRALQDDTQTPEFEESIQDTAVLYGIYDGLLKRFDIARATDMFTQFVQHFADRTFATEIRRYHYGFQRMSHDA